LPQRPAQDEKVVTLLRSTGEIERKLDNLFGNVEGSISICIKLKL